MGFGYVWLVHLVDKKVFLNKLRDRLEGGIYCQERCASLHNKSHFEVYSISNVKS